MFVFKIIGKGDQGVRSSIRVLGKSLFMSGFYVQAFSLDGDNEYSYSYSSGFVKADKDQVLSRQLEAPDMVLLYDNIDGAKDVKDGGCVILNACDKLNVSALKKRKVKVFCVDARGISTELKVPESVVMLGALIKVFGKVSLKKLKTVIEEEMGKDYSNAVDSGYKSVKRG